MAIVVTVKQKFQVLAWVVGGVVLAGMAISLAANQFLVTANNRIYNDSTKGIEKVSKVQRFLSESRTQETLAVSYAAVVNLEKLAELEQAMAVNRSGIGTLINELAISDDEQAALRDLAARYFASTEMTFNFAKSYVTDEASKNITEQSKTHFEKMDSALKQLMDANVAAAQEQNGKASSYAAFSRALIFAALAVTAGLIVFLRAFSRSIVNPIGRMEEVVKRIAAGDLTRLVDVSSRDEIGEMGKALNEMTAYLRTMARQAEEIAGGSLKDEVVLKSENDVLGKAFNKMIEGLRALIAEIRTGSERLANAATNIALSADQTSKNSETSASAVEEMTATMHEMSANMQNVTTTTQRQASSVAETSASIEQMMASIQSVAEYVRRLIGITQNSRTAVSGGADAVDKAAVGMNEINGAIRRSEQIINSLGEKTDDMSRIVEVIDEISEQTNLLALNAAIEAARAGEQGMGFAVVADEVRKLAERSAQSTREIAELIQSIARESKNAVEHMNKSSALVQRGLSFSGEVIASLDGIRTAVEELSKYSQEIGMATEEQSKGSEQIRKAVSMLNDAIHQISSASEQQSVGAEQVVKAIERVKDMVQQGSSNAVELAGSAEQLNHQAMVLHSMVERFVLSENGGRSGSSEPVRAA